MENASKNKLFIAAFGLLILINVGLMGTIWWRSGLHMGFGKMMAPPHEPARPHGPLEDVLHMDHGQSESFKGIKQGHFQRIDSLADRLRQSKKTLLILSGQPNSEVLADSLAQDIGRLQASLELENYTHFSQIWALCDEEQKKEFAEFLQRMGEEAFHAPPRRPMRQRRGD